MKFGRTVPAWTLFLVALSLPILAHAEKKIQLQFLLTEDTWCQSATMTITRSASHPGSNPLARYNENNPGQIFTCRTKPQDMVYTIFGGVYNSRDGNAYFWGKGVQLRTPALGGFWAGIGGELSAVYYEFNDHKGHLRVLSHITLQQLGEIGTIPPAKRGVAILPLPVLTRQIGYSWSNRVWGGDISFVDRNLAGKAHLRGFEISIQRRGNFL